MMFTFANILFVIVETFVIIGLASVGAEVAIGTSDDPDEKLEKRQQKIDFFKEESVKLFNEAAESTYPAWLAKLMTGMIQAGDAIPSFFVRIANYRQWFDHGGKKGN